MKVLREALKTSDSGDTRLGTVAPAQAGMHAYVPLPLSGQSAHAFAFAMEEAEALGHSKVEPLHLLLGLLRQQPSEAAELLAQAGVTQTSLRECLRQTVKDQS